MTSQKPAKIHFRYKLTAPLAQLRTSLRNRSRYLRKRQLGWLVIRLGGDLPRNQPPQPRWLPTPFGPARSAALSRLELFLILDQVKSDKRIPGVIIHLQPVPVGWAAAAEIRAKLVAFAKSGKTLVIYCDFDIDMKSYFLASAANQVLMPPIASWSPLGLSAYPLFLKDALAAWGIEFEVLAVSPHKTAGDRFVRNNISEAHEAAIRKQLQAVQNVFSYAVAESRDLNVSQVQKLLDRGIIRAPRAEAEGLIDAAIYEDQIPDRIRPLRKSPSAKGEKDIRKSVKMVELRQVQRWLFEKYKPRSGRAIGIIEIGDAIIPGRSQRLPLPIRLPLLGNQQAGAHTIAQQVRRGARDARLAALVLVIDSPGGSSLASDLIWREISQAAKRKPVIAFLDNVAASGGYYAAVAASHIVAQPLTLTGSIGVIIFRPVVGGLLEQFVVHRAAFKTGQHADVFSGLDPLSEQSLAMLNRTLNDSYDDFLERVQSGRRMTRAELEPLAGGRIWMGTEALEHGLVDTLGDFEAALVRARSMADLPESHETPPVWLSAKPAAQRALMDPMKDAQRLIALFKSSPRSAWALLPYWPES